MGLTTTCEWQRSIACQTFSSGPYDIQQPKRLFEQSMAVFWRTEDCLATFACFGRQHRFASSSNVATSRQRPSQQTRSQIPFTYHDRHSQSKHSQGGLNALIQPRSSTTRATAISPTPFFPYACHRRHSSSLNIHHNGKRQEKAVKRANEQGRRSQEYKKLVKEGWPTTRGLRGPKQQKKCDYYGPSPEYAQHRFGGKSSTAAHGYQPASV